LRPCIEHIEVPDELSLQKKNRFNAIVIIKPRHPGSAGLTIVANVAIAAGPALFYNKFYLLHYM